MVLERVKEQKTQGLLTNSTISSSASNKTKTQVSSLFLLLQLSRDRDNDMVKQRASRFVPVISLSPLANLCPLSDAASPVQPCSGSTLLPEAQ